MISNHAVILVTEKLKEAISKYIGVDFILIDKPERMEWFLCETSGKSRRSPDVVLKVVEDEYEVFINLEEERIRIKLDSKELTGWIKILVNQFANRYKLNKRKQTKQKGKEMLKDDNAVEMNKRVMELVANYPQVEAIVVEDIVVNTVSSISVYRKEYSNNPWFQLRISIMKGAIPTPLQESGDACFTYIVVWSGEVLHMSEDLDQVMEVLESFIRKYLLSSDELREINESNAYKEKIEWSHVVGDTFMELKELLKIDPLTVTDCNDDRSILKATYQSDLHEIEVYARSDEQGLYYVKSTLGIDVADTKQTDFDLVLTANELTKEQLFKYITLQLKMKQIADVMK